MTAKIIARMEEDRGPTRPPRSVLVVECVRCHTHVALWDSWATECHGCGTEYNGSGQRLAPREQWGEETGEDWRDL
jgi:hypothetical protein